MKKLTKKLNKPAFKWDAWQKTVLTWKGSITIRCGRQVGKSTTVGKRAADLMLEYIGSASLIIAPAQRQSSQLFIKVMSWLNVKHQEVLEAAGGFKSNPKLSAKRNMEMMRQYEYDNGIFNENPTKTTVILKADFLKPRGDDNEGSICYALPAGKTGAYLRNYALDFLYIDEAAYVPETVYTALKPMLAVSAKLRGLGWESFLSTPFGKGGFFFDSHHSDEYKQVHVSSEDCPRIGKDFLMKEKRRLSKAEYAQEWLGEFVDEYNQYFKTELIKECMTFIDWNKADDARPGARYYLGQDLARLGGDEIANVIIEEKDLKLKAVKCITREKKLSTATIGETVVLDGEWKFNRIFTDSGGLGGPMLDFMQEKLGTRRVVGLDNASKRIIVQGEEKKRGIFKEDLYGNCLMLMETGKLELINDLDLLRSLKSITREYTAEGKLKITGPYSHLTEALVRGCWCVKEKGLDLYIF